MYQLGGFPFVCIPGIPDSEETYQSGTHDGLELSLLGRWLRRGDGCIDVGANLGLYSLAASHFLHGSGTVLAIEASPELAESLRASALRLGARNLVVESCVVGAANQSVTFYTSRSGRFTGEQSLHPNPQFSDDYLPRDLPMRTLQEILVHFPAFSQPAAVKIDIEGNELAALTKTPPGWLTAQGPLWIAEINPLALARNGCAGAALAECFSADAFERWLSPKHARSGERDPPPRKYSPAEPFADAWFYNLIAIPRGNKWRDRLPELVAFLARPVSVRL